MRKLFYTVLVVMFLLILSGCADADVGESTSGETETSVSVNENDSSDVLIKIYTKSDSQEYKSLGNSDIHLDSAASQYAGATSIRFVSEYDDVTVSLDYCEWSAEENDFVVSMPDIFSVIVSMGQVYSFEAEIAEAMPQWRLTVKHGNYTTEWYLKHDGQTDSGVIELKNK